MRMREVERLELWLEDVEGEYEDAENGRYFEIKETLETLAKAKLERMWGKEEMRPYLRAKYGAPPGSEENKDEDS